MRLSGARALVTGAGSGIGRAVIERLVAEGASTAALDVRPGAARATAEALPSGSRSVWFDCDVRDEESVEAAVSGSADALNGLDTVVTCAGISLSGPGTDSTSLADWNLLVGINLTGTFLTIKHCLPHLLAAGGGSIVTVGSVASLVAAGRTSSYDASKAGVLGLTRSVAAEFAGRGIKANCICPGLVSTDLGANSWEVANGSPRHEQSPPPPVRITPPDPRRAAPEEIAAAVAFLCSSDASFCNGAAFPVDGGYTAI